MGIGTRAAPFSSASSSDLRRTAGEAQVGLTWNEISRQYVDDEQSLQTKVWRGRAAKQAGREGVVKVGGTTQDVVALPSLAHTTANCWRALRQRWHG